MALQQKTTGPAENLQGPSSLSHQEVILTQARESLADSSSQLALGASFCQLSGTFCT